MLFSDVNPFMRFAQLQPEIDGNELRAAYDHRIFYVLNRSSVLYADRKEYQVQPGSVIYFPPGIPYQFVDPIKVIVLNFDLTRDHADLKKPHAPDSIPAFRRDQIFEDAHPEELSGAIVLHRMTDLEPLLKKCVTNHLSPTPYSDALTSALIKEILCTILCEFRTFDAEQPEIIQEVMLYIAENFEKEIRNTDVATAFGYHPIYLNRIFKEHTGKTLHQMLLHVRVKNAGKMLKRTPLSIEEIAAQCGFSDRAQFCTSFRRIAGMTPSDYRKKKAGL